MQDDLTPLLARLETLPRGYRVGRFEGRRYGVTVRSSEDGSRWWLFGEELGGVDRVSCNVYRLSDGSVRLRPCEMPAEKVTAFVADFEPDAH